MLIILFNALASLSLSLSLSLFFFCNHGVALCQFTCLCARSAWLRRPANCSLVAWLLKPRGLAMGRQPRGSLADAAACLHRSIMYLDCPLLLIPR